MRFNKEAAIWTFVAVLVAWVISIGVARFAEGRELPLIGSLIYGILGLFASIITGLVIRKGNLKKKINN